MGISGLTPFLIKTCPHVVREIPDRFASFTGKTIAIDGTLITQRLWWSGDPHQYRHVRGWHRILRELKKNNVKVVCVFDGDTRTSAKSLELQKRQVSRDLLSSRAIIEGKRRRRLHSLSLSWRRFRELDPARKANIASSILGMAHTSGNRPSVHDRDVAKYVREDDDLADNLVVPSLSTSEVLFEEAMVDGWVHHQSCSTPALQPASKASVHELLPHVDSAEGVADVAKPDRRESQAGLVKRMTVLYRNFKRSVDGDPTTAHFRPSVTTVVPNFVDGQATVTQLIPSIIPDTVPEPLSDFNDSCQPVLVDGEESDDEAKAQAELATMSKLQANLAVEEGRIWALVLHDVHVPEDGAVTKPTPEVPRIVEDDDRINKVTQRLYQLCAASDSLNQSYAKRNKTPTGRTYAEARTIMNAMGAAVIEAPYPFEAEGVAASLYAHGVADVVASEDTDVIVYDAPLLRNLTSRDHPLIYTSGREVREALSLSRSSFVDFALLLGSDFSQRLAGLGPSRAIKLIQAKGSIEAIIQSERAKEKGQKFLPEPKLTEEEYLKQVEAGRMVFQTLPPISEDIKMELMKPRSIDEASVAEILRAFDLGADFWHDGVSEHEDPLQVDYYDPALQGLHGDYIYA